MTDEEIIYFIFSLRAVLCNLEQGGSWQHAELGVQSIFVHAYASASEALDGVADFRSDQR